MIVSRKPWTIYDVDAIGGGCLVVVLLASWWLVFAPWQQTWSSYRALADERSETAQRLRDDVASAEEYYRQLDDLEQLVSTQAHEVPAAAQLSKILQQFTDIAKGERIELVSVAPEPATLKGAYVVTDIRVEARGTSVDFIRFLDRLAVENPYQSLRDCVIKKPAGGAAERCSLSWTVRLYMQPDAGGAAEGLAK